MASAQPLDIDKEERKPKILVKSEEEEKHWPGLVCQSNFEDSGFYGDPAAAKDRVENNALDQEVNVTEFVDDEVAELEKNEDDPDATEHSSSFGNTFSGSEEEARMSSGDMEVDSQFSMENGEQQVLDAIGGRLLKKKKVTDHWRRFINPLMWRCQWLELRMNELRLQALLYDKELAAYKREKQLQSKMIELDDSVSKSVPFTCQSHRKRAMKRKKRKRIEDTVDIPSYMSNHSVFSYYENKRAETDCQSVDNECGDQVDEVLKPEDYEWILRGLKDGDNSLEEILLNLDSIWSRICTLKSQLGDVMCRNPRDFSSTSPSCSPSNNGDAMPCELELPGSAVSSYGDAADVLYHQHDLMNDIVITDELGHEDYIKLERAGHGGVLLHEELKEEAESCSEDAKSASKSPAAPEIILKPCYTGKKRGRKPKRKRRGGFASRIQKRRLS